MSQAFKTATDANFDELVLGAGDKPVLVDFWAEWCAPCRAQLPILEQVSTKLGERVIIAKLNVDENQGVSNALAVRAIPTMILFHKGDVKEVFVGVKPAAELMASFSKYLISPTDDVPAGAG